MGFEACSEFLNGNISSGGSCSFIEGLFLGSFVAFGILTLLFFLLGIYVYHSLAWTIIARKLKHRHSWLAWIPFASLAMRLQLGKFAWQWIFLVFIPFLGWLVLLIMAFIAHWRIYEQRKYPGWFSLAILLPQIGGVLYFIIIGFVAWKDRKRPLFR